MYPNDSDSSKSADSVLYEIVLPELTRHLNKKASDFEVTNDQPAVLKLVSSASVAFWQMTLTVNSLQAFLSENNDAKEKLQKIMEASSTITAAFRGVHLFNMMANVPVYAKSSKTDEEQ